MRIFFRSQLLFVPASTWNCAAFASALSRPFDFRASDSLFVIAADLMRRSVAPSQESACWCSSDSGVGSFFRANCNCSRHSSQLLYDKQFGNCKKNVLEPMTQIACNETTRTKYMCKIQLSTIKKINENCTNVQCRGRITNLPIANASAEVVHNTSLVDILRKILCSTISLIIIWSCTPRNRAGTGLRLHWNKNQQQCKMFDAGGQIRQKDKTVRQVCSTYLKSCFGGRDILEWIWWIIIVSGTVFGR